MKRQQVFYRIEKEGVGPYQEDTDWQTCTHSKRNGRPAPICDKFIIASSKDIENEFFEYTSGWDNFPYKDMNFGFISLYSLTEWFSKMELKNLDHLGFKISKYSSTEWVLFARQAAFTRDKFLGIVSIKTLVEDKPISFT